MNRWRVVIGGMSMNLALGSLYAWSVFVLPLEKEFGWTFGLHEFLSCQNTAFGSLPEFLKRFEPLSSTDSFGDSLKTDSASTARNTHHPANSGFRSNVLCPFAFQSCP